MIVPSLVAGLVLLVLGGEFLTRGAVAVARALRVSPLVIGLTLVGFGTSTPELAASVQAALADAPGIAVGNVVGSNICNILLILGLAALLRPMAVDREAFARDGCVLVIATAFAVAALAQGALGRPAGGAFLLMLVGYLVVAFSNGREVASDEPADVAAPTAPLVVAASIIGGLAGLLLGAGLLVDAAVAMADRLDVPESVIGLSVVAVGTSLPELATSVVAALRGRADVAFGNIVGSNIFNLFGILGVTALVRPLTTPPDIAAVDIWVMAAATVALVAVVMTGWRVNRMEGGALLAGYAGYVFWLTRAL